MAAVRWLCFPCTCRPLLLIIIQQRPRAEEAVVVAHAVVTVQRAGVITSVVATVIVALEK